MGLVDNLTLVLDKKPNKKDPCEKEGSSTRLRLFKKTVLGGAQ